jgi:5-formyltetrahydrofolate cyclo-ligase
MSDHGGPAATKSDLRGRLLAARDERALAERERAAEQLRNLVLELPEVEAARMVAAYVSLPTEPGTGPILGALHERGVTVLLPVLQPDSSLEWAPYEPGQLRPNWRGIREPATGRRQHRLARASVVICPGVAGDPHGGRLGRGGGSYDRALADLGPGALRCLLLYDEEVLDAVPTDAQDQSVDVIVTPTRILRVSARRR